MKPPLSHRRLHYLLAILAMFAPGFQAFADSPEVGNSEERREERQTEEANGSKAISAPEKVSDEKCPGIATKAGSDQLRLIFKGETLENIAAAFNRCNVMPQIRVEGRSLQARRFTLIVDADDPNSLLDYLAIDANIVIEAEDTQLFVVRLRSKTPSRDEAVNGGPAQFHAIGP